MIDGWNGWTQPKQIIEKHKKGEGLTSRDLLVIKSRSFIYPILGLKRFQGPKETNKEPHFRTLYNLLRMQDTIEDSKLSTEERIDLLNKWEYVVNEVASRERNAGIDDLVNGHLTKISDGLFNLGSGKKGKKRGNFLIDENEEIFVTHFAKGQVLRDFGGLQNGLRENYLNCMQKMATGMKHFLETGKIETSSDLKRYCEYVAGYVGVAINDTVSFTDNFDMNDEDAKGYGIGLQIVNILKNNKEDRDTRKVSYLPVEWGTGDDAIDSALKFADDYLKPAIDYNLGISEGHTGLAFFSIVPLLTARETLSLMREGGAQVLEGNEKYTKISNGTFKNILAHSAMLVGSDVDPEERYSFLRDYGADPRAYSFEPGKFEKWGHRYDSIGRHTPLPEEGDKETGKVTPAP